MSVHEKHFNKGNYVIASFNLFSPISPPPFFNKLTISIPSSVWLPVCLVFYYFSIHPNRNSSARYESGIAGTTQTSLLRPSFQCVIYFVIIPFPYLFICLFFSPPAIYAKQREREREIPFYLDWHFLILICFVFVVVE